MRKTLSGYATDRITGRVLIEGNEDEMRHRAIRVTLQKYERVDLLVATSPDLPGLVVHGRTPDEIQTKIPAIIQDLLEASGSGIGGVCHV